jgi:hypothetical protein
LYFTDNLIAYASWRTSWEIWLKQVRKEEDDYTITGMEAETHLGRIYLGRAAVNVNEFELKSILEE